MSQEENTDSEEYNVDLLTADEDDIPNEDFLPD
jgi:hypothetical protein